MPLLETITTSPYYNAITQYDIIRDSTTKIIIVWAVAVVAVIALCIIIAYLVNAASCTALNELRFRLSRVMHILSWAFTGAAVITLLIGVGVFIVPNKYHDRIVQTEADYAVTCAECGAANPEGAICCGLCNDPINEEDLSTEVLWTSYKRAKADGEFDDITDTEKICPHCLGVIQAVYSHCPYCGKPCPAKGK